MKRIMVLGCCGSGKSTFSRKLHERVDVDLFHLDQYYWLPNWVEMRKPEFAEIVTALASRAEWIIDGNYGSTMDIRLKEADTIIYLDYPTTTCLWRITKRIFKYHGQVRPDMPSGCKERFDLEFYHYVLTFNLLRRKNILAKLDKVKDQKEILIFKNDRETANFLNKQ